MINEHEIHEVNYLWFWTLFPAMKLLSSVPQTENISSAVLTFSPPWSPLTLQKQKNKNKQQQKAHIMLGCIYTQLTLVLIKTVYEIKHEHGYDLFFFLFWKGNLKVNPQVRPVPLHPPVDTLGIFCKQDRCLKHLWKKTPILSVHIACDVMGRRSVA